MEDDPEPPKLKYHKCTEKIEIPASITDPAERKRYYDREYYRRCIRTEGKFKTPAEMREIRLKLVQLMKIIDEMTGPLEECQLILEIAQEEKMINELRRRLDNIQYNRDRRARERNERESEITARLSGHGAESPGEADGDEKNPEKDEKID
jgi:hypothetical protein